MIFITGTNGIISRIIVKCTRRTIAIVCCPALVVGVRACTTAEEQSTTQCIWQRPSAPNIHLEFEQGCMRARSSTNPKAGVMGRWRWIEIHPTGAAPDWNGSDIPLKTATGGASVADGGYGPPNRSNELRTIMNRNIAFAYGIFAYVVFFLTFLYAIAFVGNIFVPKTIDSGEESGIVGSLVINLALLSIFALQHTIMARPKFKEAWTKIVPKPIERSTYVLLSSVALILIFAFWRPMQGIVWDVSGTFVGTVALALFWIGFLVVLLSTFMIDHFDLFGLRQVYLNLKQRQFNHMGFRKALFYRVVRHPIMSGFIVAFWAAPVMTVGHLLFAAVTTAYIYIAVKHFEEKDLVALIGPDYIEYQKEVGMLIPGVGKTR